DELFSTWGKNDRLLVNIKLTSENGFVLSQYSRSRTAEHPYNSTTELRYSYDSLATLNVIQDLSELYKQHDRLAYQLLGGVVPITLAIWFLIYLINRMNHEIIQRQQTEEELFKEKEYAEVTLHSIGDAVITTDNRGVITFINPIAEGLTGWTTQEARGNLLEDVFNIVNESTMEPCENPVQDCLRQGRSVGLTNYTALIKRDGTRISIDDSASPIRNRSGDIIGVILVFHDVTRDREMTRQISWQATHDSLTGLINRNELEIRLNEVINDAKVESASNCFLYMDLDQFKVVNDTCGHQAGDKLLEQLSYLLQQNIRDSDILARLGGDEFGVLLTGCSIEKATSIAEMLRKTVEEFRFIWQEKTFEIGASIGVVSINPNDDSTATLLSAADIACYAAKDHGRNRVHVYQPDDKELMQRHGEMKWVSQITKALKEDRFELFCQSIQKINNATQNEYHFEILVRMLDEEDKYIPPGFFIPAAERYDLMPKIDEWVLKNTFKIIQENKNSSAFNKLHTVSINLSGNTFSSKDFLGRIREMLKIYEVPTSMICFEITETAAIANLTEAITFI
ncbi:MAG: diguanylate cyclase, partial [Gammaproteobacteria bacterium]|nr:diguanylate cyclase [Gammaproteobacteria bacterium]